MNTVTLQERHIRILKNADLKDDFIAGIILLLQGEEPQASCSILKDIFFILVNGSTAIVIPGIPKFDQTKVKNSMLEIYNKVQAGKVPSSGLGHGYKDLKFRPIKTLEKVYLKKLYSDCLSRINNKQKGVEYRRFISYLAEVIEHCVNSGEL